MDDRPTEDEGLDQEHPSEEAPEEVGSGDDGEEGVHDLDDGVAVDSGTEPHPQESMPDFEQLPEAKGEGQPAALSLLYDLDLPVAIELGRTRMSVQDVLALSRGSVVQLDRQAGEPVDVFVGDRRFAEGEVVIVGEQFGVRITRVLAATPVDAVSVG